MIDDDFKIRKPAAMNCGGRDLRGEVDREVVLP
jgi:hypothetical protein